MEAAFSFGELHPGFRALLSVGFSLAPCWVCMLYRTVLPLLLLSFESIGVGWALLAFGVRSSTMSRGENEADEGFRSGNLESFFIEYHLVQRSRKQRGSPSPELQMENLPTVCALAAVQGLCFEGC